MNKKINLGCNEKHRVDRGEHGELDTCSIVTARQPELRASDRRRGICSKLMLMLPEVQNVVGRQ